MRKAAFTLIELMISVGIASVILVASYLCLSAGIASQKVIEPRAQALQSARVAMAMISADLRAACSLDPDFDFLGEARTIGNAEADNVDFATRHYLPQRPNEGDYCETGYYVDRSRSGNGYSLWRRRNPRLAPDPLNGGSREEIVPGLLGFTLEYFDGVDWYDSWGDANVKNKTKYTTVEAPNASGFPEAVRITLLVDTEPDEKKGKDSPKSPFIFQTVARVELADAPAASGSSGGNDSNAQSVPNQNGGAN